MSAEILFYRYLLNPAMRGLLRSPLHRLASGNIAILHFKGRKSGRWLNTPLSYMREGNRVRLLSNTNTRWWLNLRDGPVGVQIEIQAKRYNGSAMLYEGDSEATREGVRKFIAAVPRDAKIYGLKLDKNKQLLEPSLSTKVHELILVEIALEPAPSPA
ncbi:nitroreductase family deazaflavin-dependent oxidoreductase [bacterium]|nr:nitroreductase family deazaflavin-dependent oxidoreductase [bacterium]